MKGPGDNSLERSAPPLTSSFVRDLYTRMLLTRKVDDCVCHLHQFGIQPSNAAVALTFGQHGCKEVNEGNDLAPSCRGREAAQVGSAICIEVGMDFTLPYSRDLGVVLTIGMSPYEVLLTHVQYVQTTGIQVSEEQRARMNLAPTEGRQPISYWGYSKHNIVAGPVPVSTQILHAAGIAFACKLRKGSAVTVAYCGDEASAEPDFLEGITFAAQHQLPAVFVYEQDRASATLQALPLPGGLEYHAIDGTDVIAVYVAMQSAMQHAREGHGPVLLELKVCCPLPDTLHTDGESQNDPLYNCQKYMEETNLWDDEWAAQLNRRLSADVGRAMQDALQEQAKYERDK
jgi:2-oxoisovalerate dehydrogenase E1 component alpha subunit